MYKSKNLDPISKEILETLTKKYEKIRMSYHKKTYEMSVDFTNYIEDLLNDGKQKNQEYKKVSDYFAINNAYKIIYTSKKAKKLLSKKVNDFYDKYDERFRKEYDEFQKEAKSLLKDIDDLRYER